VPALNAIGIVSKDLAASVRFYRLLGVKLPEPDGDHVEATLPSGLRLMLDDLKLIKELDKAWIPPRGHPIVLAFECASPAEVDSVYAKMTAAGHASKAAPWDAFWGQRYAEVLDPDGNVVDLFAALPGQAA
jgi:uncharacterized glyoxalase superfamily protein PhnB